MIAADREWRRVPGASANSLSKLQAAVGLELPASYYQLLAFSNGGEGPLPVQPWYFQLDPAEAVMEAIAQRIHEEFFPEFVVFGSNGGGEFVAFDVRKEPPWPVVAIDMTNINIDESLLPIASDFESFLEMVGLGAPL